MGAGSSGMAPGSSDMAGSCGSRGSEGSAAGSEGRVPSPGSGGSDSGPAGVAGPGKLSRPGATPLHPSARKHGSMGQLREKIMCRKCDIYCTGRESCQHSIDG